MTVPAVHIKAGGSDLNPAYEVISVDVHAEANKIPWAEICILDGDAALRKFEVSESGDLDLGKKVSISLAYVDAPSSLGPVFEGLITRHAIEMDTRGQILRIECRHPAFLMTKVRKRMVFEKMADKDIIAKLAASTKGLCSIKGLKLKGPVHPQMIQYDVTDWDFLLARCKANGWLVFANGKDLAVQAIAPPAGSAAKDATMDFNINEIFSLELALDAEAQYAKTVVKAYDLPGELPMAEGAGTAGIGPGNSKPAAIPNLSKGVMQELISPTNLDPAELKAWSKGSIDRSQMAFYRGRFELQGNSKIELGKACKINGIGTKFDGAALVSGIRQRVTTSGWTTDVQIGMPHPEKEDGKSVMSPPANGLVPGVSGIQVGIVQAFKANEKDKYKVLVYLPAMDVLTNLIWARIGMPFGGGGGKEPAGMMFWPDEGDEVIVGFFNDDPRSAVILGSLYNSQTKVPFPPEAKNMKKGLVTKGGSRLEFDDTELEVLLSTKENVEVRINEKKQSLSITELKQKANFTLDKTGVSIEFKKNSLKITEDGILLTAGEHKVELAAAGITALSTKKLQLTGSKGVKMDGGPKVDILGKKIDLK